MLNLDTPILLGALADELTRREREQLAREPWGIAAIVLWEIGNLAELGRIAVVLDDRDFMRTLARIHVWPLTLDVCRANRTLDFRGDPADELIAATSACSPGTLGDARCAHPALEARAAGPLTRVILSAPSGARQGTPLRMGAAYSSNRLATGTSKTPTGI